MNRLHPAGVVLALLLLMSLWGGVCRAQDEGDRSQAAPTAADRDAVQKQLQAEPANAQLWKRLSVILRRLGDEKGGEDALRKAASLDPADAGINFMMGLLHEKRGESAEAAASFKTCAEHSTHERFKQLCLKHLRRVEKP